MYLTYEEYQSMGGTLSADLYDDFEFEAEAVIDWYTFNRLKGDTAVPEAVKRLMKYLINSAQKRANIVASSADPSSGVGATVASQSNDGVSISYNILSASEIMESLKSSEADAVTRFLQGVVNEAGRKLLYRGLYPGE